MLSGSVDGVCEEQGEERECASAVALGREGGVLSAAAPDGEAEARLVIADTDTEPPGLGGDFGDPLCCVPLGLVLNKSSRMEMSPINSVSRDRRLGVDRASSGLSPCPLTATPVLGEELCSPCAEGLDGAVSQSWLRPEEGGVSLSL